MSTLLRLAAALSCALFSSCASAPTARPVTGTVEVAPDTSGILSLIGRDGLAHACPIAPDLALTNDHVVEKDSITGQEDVAPFMWESGGVIGLLGGRGLTVRDRFRDLAFVKPYKSAFPRFYAIAKEPPAVGDRVWFIGYDFRKKDSALAPRLFDATVKRVRVGHVAFYRAGVKGSSGSCLLNARGEVVAVNQGGFVLDDEAVGDISGLAVGVWPPLLELGQ